MTTANNKGNLYLIQTKCVHIILQNCCFAEFAFNSLESLDIKIKVLSIEEEARDEVFESFLRSKTTNLEPILLTKFTFENIKLV